jgi:hypothetical protein
MLALGLTWTAVIRVPLALNAEDHLDSDLAVDGLTLLDAANGRWRWHYPGTPHMGILPVLASYPQALEWGANPITLVSGGIVLWGLVVGSTFWLAWRCYGPSVAGWAIVPLVFSSMGTIWLSGRITGGHLLALAWHILAFVGLHACWKRPGWRCAGLLGAWCGLGLFVDAMVLFTVAGVAGSAFLGWLMRSRSRSGIVVAAAFLAGLVVGAIPREIGRRLDPYDAYPSQFAATFHPPVIAGHAGLLAEECLPRLIAGTGLQGADRSAGGQGTPLWASPANLIVLLVMMAFAIAVVRLAIDGVRGDEPVRRAAARGTLLSGVLVVAAFVVNRNIYNSDNYRYLVFLLAPWSIGFGLCLRDLSRRGVRGRISAVLAVVLLAAGMTLAAFRWYRDTRKYLDDRGMPVRRARPHWSELVILPDRARAGLTGPGRGQSRVFTIAPEVTHVFGGYWDVYRLAFLSGGRIIGIPYPAYPNRFRGWSDGLGPGRGKIVILRPIDESSTSPRPAAERPGGWPERVGSARSINWWPPFMTVWIADGRDTTELGQLEVVVP